MKKRSLFMDILQSATRYFSILVVIVIVGILCSGIRVIKTGNQAIILRFGKVVGDTYEQQVHGPGLLLAFPYIIDEVIVVPTDKVYEQSITTHYSGSVNGTTSETGYVMTGDSNIAVISASVKYTVSNPVTYALKIEDLPGIIDACVSSAMVSEASHMRVDSLLTDEKDQFAKAIMDIATQKLNEIDAGIRLSSIELTQVAMPEEVRGIYEEVNSATVHVSTMLERARQQREKIIPEAKAQADTTISNAKTLYSQKVADARQSLAEFWGVLDEYQTNPEGVKARIYSQKVKEFIGGIEQIRIVSDGDTNVFLDPGTTAGAAPAVSEPSGETPAPSGESIAPSGESSNPSTPE